MVPEAAVLVAEEEDATVLGMELWWEFLVEEVEGEDLWLLLWLEWECTGKETNINK